MFQSWMLIAAVSTTLTFVLTLLIGIRRIRTNISDDIKKDLTLDFKEDFISEEYCETCSKQTCEKLDSIDKKLEQGSKEFLVIRLIFMEAKLVPRAKIEEIRNTVMNGGT